MIRSDFWMCETQLLPGFFIQKWKSCHYFIGFFPTRVTWSNNNTGRKSNMIPLGMMPISMIFFYSSSKKNEHCPVEYLNRNIYYFYNLLVLKHCRFYIGRKYARWEYLFRDRAFPFLIGECREINTNERSVFFLTMSQAQSHGGEWINGVWYLEWSVRQISEFSFSYQKRCMCINRKWHFTYLYIWIVCIQCSFEEWFFLFRNLEEKTYLPTSPEYKKGNTHISMRYWEWFFPLSKFLMYAFEHIPGSRNSPVIIAIDSYLESMKMMRWRHINILYRCFKKKPIAFCKLFPILSLCKNWL